MLKKILSYGLVEGVSKGLNKALLLILPFYLLTPDYGKIGLIVASETIIPFICLLGFERATLRFYSFKNDFKSFSSTIFSSIAVTHMVMLVLAIILYLFGITSIMGLDLFPDIFLLIIFVFLQGRNLVKFNMLRVSENHKSYFQGRIFYQITKFVLILSLVLITSSYLYYLIGGIIAALLTNLLIFKSSVDKDKGWDVETFNILIAFSWPLIFHGVSKNLLGNIDRFLLKYYMELDSVGIYTLAYAIGSVITFAYVGISVFLEPLIYKEGDLARRTTLMDKFLTISITIGSICYAIILLSAFFIIPRIYNDQFDESLVYVPLIALSHLFMPFYLKSNYKLLYDKESLKIAVLSSICLVINILLNVVLIPFYGIFGSVLATFSSYIFQALLFEFVASKYKIKNEFLEILFLGAFFSLGIILELNNVFMLLIIGVYLTYKWFKLKR